VVLLPWFRSQGTDTLQVRVASSIPSLLLLCVEHAEAISLAIRQQITSQTAGSSRIEDTHSLIAQWFDLMGEGTAEQIVETLLLGARDWMIVGAVLFSRANRLSAAAELTGYNWLIRTVWTVKLLSKFVMTREASHGHSNCLANSS